MSCAAILGTWASLAVSGQPEQIATIRPVVAASALQTPEATEIPPKPTQRPTAPPTAKPTPKPPAKPTPAAVQAPAGSVKARVLAAWPGDDVWAAKVVWCESRFNPRATGGHGNNYWGLWQFGPWARSRDGQGDPRVQSPEQQTARAWALIKVTNSRQWECSPYWYDP